MWLAFATFGNPRDIIWLNTRKKKLRKEPNNCGRKGRNMNNILWKCSSHFNFRSQKRLYKNVKTCDMTAKCMMHVTCCWSIEKKKRKKNPGDQSIFIMGGGGEGDGRGFEGGSKSFPEEQKEDQTSPTEYKVGDYWKLTAGEPPLRGDFIVTQTKSSSSQGINITGPLRKMSLFRARLRDNFNFKESGKTD